MNTDLKYRKQNINTLSSETNLRDKQKDIMIKVGLYKERKKGWLNIQIKIQ